MAVVCQFLQFLFSLSRLFVERNGVRPGFGLPSHRCRGVFLGSLLPFSLGKGVHWRCCWSPLVGDAGPSFHSSTPWAPLCDKLESYQVPPAQRLR
ncbi:hypothetical protein B0T21DRAFT_367859 [Apiosordaria backusii]|uniref:Secreted protein n=1 Tax=Apiosordaria backusii TaxID=314023 RepID=A0AA40BJN1_9PEZI|nr:hypothetical protein B0T21DRAFT_367859 [Apiosordaria backusii]